MNASNKISEKNLKRLIPNDLIAEVVKQALLWGEKERPGFLGKNNKDSIFFELHQYSIINNGKLCSFCSTAGAGWNLGRPSPEGNPRVSVLLRDKSPEISFSNNVPSLGSPPEGSSFIGRVDIPLKMLLPTSPKVGSYFLYQIRFNFDFVLEQEVSGMDPLMRGYIGITKRDPFIRLKEHMDKARANSGYLFHTAWNHLMRELPKAYPVFQIAGWADTLEEIYELEERAVDDLTLTPKGLNAIPGGKAGIRMLQQLSLLNRSSRIPSLSDREKALVILESRKHSKGSPCSHYRKAHMRRLAVDRIVFVNGCWVNQPSNYLDQ